MKKINVLMISATGKIGGGPNVMFKLGRKMTNKINIFYAIPQNKIFQNYLNKNDTIFIAERSINLIDILKLIKFIRSNSIDIIHAHGKGASLIARILKLFTHIKLVYTYHGIHIKCHSKYNKLVYYFYETLLGNLDNLKVFVSRSEREYAKSINLYNGKNYVVINNGVENLVKKQNINLNKNEIKKINVISVCRFVEQKNIFEIMKIASILNDINFCIIGDGPLFNEIQQFKHKYLLNNIALPGFKSNIFDYLNNSEIYLSTSIYEGLPISILEAMSQGMPIVASNVIGNRDTTIHNKNGFLYELGDIESASRFIRKLTNNPEKLKSFGQESLERQRELFSIENMINSHERLYYDLMKN